MPSFQLAIASFLLSLVAGQNTAPNNVSSRLMIHVSAEFGLSSRAKQSLPGFLHVHFSTKSTENCRNEGG